MRNGNWLFFDSVGTVCFGSYRTYEEWKPPCRTLTSTNASRFLPYLWGMETRRPPRRVSNPGTIVLTVPMRNGNNGKRCISIFTYCWFLPYLWGMETVFHVRCKFDSFDVLTVPMRNGNAIDVPRNPSASLAGSYRTYEEWKHHFHRGWRKEDILVLTVPMRNGNSNQSLEKWTKSEVLTVPMRNGNSQLALACWDC